MSETLATIVAELDDALAEERGALMRFDANAVEAAATRKAALAERLATALEGAADEGPGARAAMLRTLSRVRWTAEANRALLNDASELLSSVRSMPTATGTYDRRACVGRAAPALPRYGT
ncbi:MAG: hypothetical protein AAF721_08085 [Myxococcota bacterium]